jgi:hypothetical protein
MAEQRVVKYVGSATRRIITAEQWGAAGVQNQPGVEWNRANGYEISGDDLSQAALKVLDADGKFKFLLVEREPRPSPTPRVAEEPPTAG